VEQPCYKCGASVEEGVPFCPQCNAPQIRVIHSELLPEGSFPDPQAPGLQLPAAPSVRELRFPEAWRAAGLGVLAGAIPVIVLFGLPPGVGMIVAGFLSVVFYRRRLTTQRFPVRVGARLGALCGILATGALALSAAIAATVFHQAERMRTGVLDLMQQTMARMPNPPPPQVIDLFKTPAGLVLLGLIFIVVMLGFSALGGVLGAALLGRKDKI
jgi:hypothetical protein